MATDSYIASGDCADIELIHLGALIDDAAEHERNLAQVGAMDRYARADAAVEALFQIADRIAELEASTPAGVAIKLKEFVRRYPDLDDFHVGLESLLESVETLLAKLGAL